MPLKSATLEKMEEPLPTAKGFLPTVDPPLRTARAVLAECRVFAESFASRRTDFASSVVLRERPANAATTNTDSVSSSPAEWEAAILARTAQLRTLLLASAAMSAVTSSAAPVQSAAAAARRRLTSRLSSVASFTSQHSQRTSAASSFAASALAASDAAALKRGVLSHVAALHRALLRRCAVAGLPIDEAILSSPAPAPSPAHGPDSAPTVPPTPASAASLALVPAPSALELASDRARSGSLRIATAGDTYCLLLDVSLSTSAPAAVASVTLTQLVGGDERPPPVDVSTAARLCELLRRCGSFFLAFILDRSRTSSTLPPLVLLPPPPAVAAAGFVGAAAAIAAAESAAKLAPWLGLERGQPAVRDAMEVLTRVRGMRAAAEAVAGTVGESGAGVDSNEGSRGESRGCEVTVGGVPALLPLPPAGGPFAGQRAGAAGCGVLSPMAVRVQTAAEGPALVYHTPAIWLSSTSSADHAARGAAEGGQGTKDAFPAAALLGPHAGVHTIVCTGTFPFHPSSPAPAPGWTCAPRLEMRPPVAAAPATVATLLAAAGRWFTPDVVAALFPPPATATAGADAADAAAEDEPGDVKAERLEKEFLSVVAGTQAAPDCPAWLVSSAYSSSDKSSSAAAAAAAATAAVAGVSVTGATAGPGDPGSFARILTAHSYRKRHLAAPGAAPMDDAESMELAQAIAAKAEAEADESGDGADATDMNDNDPSPMAKASPSSLSLSHSTNDPFAAPAGCDGTWATAVAAPLARLQCSLPPLSPAPLLSPVPASASASASAPSPALAPVPVPVPVPASAAETVRLLWRAPPACLAAAGTRAVMALSPALAGDLSMARGTMVRRLPGPETAAALGQVTVGTADEGGESGHSPAAAAESAHPSASASAPAPASATVGGPALTQAQARACLVQYLCACAAALRSQVLFNAAFLSLLGGAEITVARAQLPVPHPGAVAAAAKAAMEADLAAAEAKSVENNAADSDNDDDDDIDDVIDENEDDDDDGQDRNDINNGENSNGDDDDDDDGFESSGDDDDAAAERKRRRHTLSRSHTLSLRRSRRRAATAAERPGEEADVAWALNPTAPRTRHSHGANSSRDEKRKVKLPAPAPSHNSGAQAAPTAATSMRGARMWGEVLVDGIAGESLVLSALCSAHSPSDASTQGEWARVEMALLCAPAAEPSTLAPAAADVAESPATPTVALGRIELSDPVAPPAIVAAADALFLRLSNLPTLPASLADVAVQPGVTVRVAAEDAMGGALLQEGDQRRVIEYAARRVYAMTSSVPVTFAWVAAAIVC